MTAKKSTLYALATFAGTIIGVGLFGLPYVGSKSGFIILLLYLLGISFLAIVIHLFYAEVAVKTKGQHRLPGYAEIYLDSSAKRAAFILQVVSLIGSLLAYLIVGGEFLAALCNGSVYVYTFIFFIISAFIIWRGIRSVGPLELILLVIFIGIIIIQFGSGLGKISWEHLTGFHLNNFFLPYGVVLFAMWGTSIIPDIKEMVGGDRRQLRKVIISGIAISLLVYLLFSFLVTGITGSQTSQDAISGLKNHLPPWALSIGLIAGVIATFTSFITLGLTLEKTFRYDYHVPKWLSWVITCFAPLALFIIGLKDFIRVIGLNGAIMLALQAIMITLIYLKIKKKEVPAQYKKIRFTSALIVILLMIGVGLEVYYFFNTI
jgi:tyrosine-specific transport protein